MRSYLGPAVCGSLLLSALARKPAIAEAQDRSPARTMELSPQSAARAAFSQDAGPSALAAHDAELTEAIPGLVKASRASAGEKATHVAEEAIWRVLKPWQRAQSSRPVRYWYIGRTIDAVICDDGSMEIRAKEGLVLTPVSIQTRKGAQPGSSEAGSRSLGSPSGAGIGIGVVDPARGVQRQLTGTSLDNEEARRLRQGTLALRERLMAEAARKESVHAAERLRGVLSGLWSAPGPRSAKAAQTFTLWDECSDDETGREGRSLIESFVRTLQEAQGSCPFDADQLAKLNARRLSKLPFSPCKGLEPADAPPTH